MFLLTATAVNMAIKVYLHISELEFTEVVWEFLNVSGCVGGVVCGGRLGDKGCH